MTLNLIPPAIAAIGKLVPGITSSMDPPPPTINTASLPLLYALTGESDYDDTRGSELLWVTRIYRIQVAVIPRNQATPNTRETQCRPLISAVRDTFAQYPQLGNVLGVQNARVVGDTGVALLPDWEGLYVGFEVRLEVTSVVERTYTQKE